MGQRGRLAELSKEDIRYTDRVVKLYYDENKKQQQIKTELGLSSVSVVAELLRRDMMKRVQEFKATPTNSPEYQEKLANIIKFLRKQRKMDFIEMATVLNLPRAEIAKYLQNYGDETSLNGRRSFNNRYWQNFRCFKTACITYFQKYGICTC